MLRGQQFLHLPFGYFVQNNQQDQKQVKNTNLKNKKEIIHTNGMKSSNTKMENYFDSVLRNHKIQFIEINTRDHQFDRLILQTHIRFYCQSNSYMKEGTVEKLKGKCYKKSCDFNKNPIFLIQEGIFRINIMKEEYLLDGEGIEYYGKSDLIKKQGLFIKGVFQELESKKKRVILEKKTYSGERIIIMDESNQIIRSKSCENDNERLKEIYRGNRILYNQQISDRDVNILRNNSMEWLTSSLIDSYVEYLNIKSELKVKKLSLEERFKINRILFIPSYVTTSFGLYEDETTYMRKAEGLLQKELLFYKELNFDVKQIYTKIGFPVNINNAHWVFLLFDFKKKEILLYDSLKSTQKRSAQPGYLCKAIGGFLNLNVRKCYVMNYVQQKDNYSCGYFVCSFMEFQYKLQFKKNYKYFYDQNNIKMKISQIVRNE